MSLESIVSGIDREIATLQQARELLLGLGAKRGPGRPRGGAAKKRRQLSPEARARIAAAQRARWAATEKSPAKAPKKASKP